MRLATLLVYLRHNEKVKRNRHPCRLGRAGPAALVGFAGIIWGAPPAAQALCIKAQAKSFETVGAGAAGKEHRFDLGTGPTVIIAFGDEKGPYKTQITVKDRATTLCDSSKQGQTFLEDKGNFTICRFELDTTYMAGRKTINVAVSTKNNEDKKAATFTVICMNELGSLSLSPRPQ